VSDRIAPKEITVVADLRVNIVRLPTMSSPIAADLQFRRSTLIERHLGPTIRATKRCALLVPKSIFV
jgi:hypothetical protein